MNLINKSVDKWKEEFGETPKQIIPDKKPLEEAWENMGVAYGRIQLEKQKYKKAGMLEAVKEIDVKLKSKQDELEGRTLDLIGYPRVGLNAKTTLQTLAKLDGLFLNVYDIAEYKKIPPPNIAEAIMEAKQYFEKLEVWAIEETAYVRPMKDPAVIGYAKVGYSLVPYLIATWGDDINPEDLMESKRLEDKKIKSKELQ